MSFLRKLGVSSEATQLNPILSINPEPDNVREKQYAASEAQWNDIFQESLRDFELKFKEEEMARSKGERARRDEFDRTMTNFRDTFQKNDLRRLELYKETDALEEERSQKADAAREAIFVQGQQDRARTFESDQEMRAKQAEWYNGVRKEFLSDGRQRFTEKYNALNAALVKQFDRLMERRTEMTEVAEEQSSSQNTLIPVPPDGGSEPGDSQSVTSSPPSPKRPSSPTSACAESLYSPSKPTSVESPSPSMRSVFQSSSSPNPESPDPLTQPTSPEFNDRQEQTPHLVEQGDPEGSTHSAEVEEDKFKAYFMRSQEKWQETFLQDESGRDRQFHASEAARDTGESERSTIFDEQIQHWSRKSQTHNYRRQEHFMRDSRRFIAFRNAESQHWTDFHMSMLHFREQAKAEMDLEEICFQRQKDMILELYKSQTIQLNQRLTENQFVWFELIRGRYCRRHLPSLEYDGPEDPFDMNFELNTASPEFFFSGSFPNVLSIRQHVSCIRARQIIQRPSQIFTGFDTRFVSSAMFGGALVEDALPIPKVANGQEPRMQRMFEQLQGLRAEAFQKGTKERDYTFTMNEARRAAEFVEIQRKRKEIFDQAEKSHESEFEKSQEQRESEFQVSEQKQEDDFNKNEAERNDQARRARENREQQFQSTMSALQQKWIDDEKRRLEELERLGDEFLMRRESGLESLNID